MKIKVWEMFGYKFYKGQPMDTIPNLVWDSYVELLASWSRKEAIENDR